VSERVRPKEVAVGPQPWALRLYGVELLRTRFHIFTRIGFAEQNGRIGVCEGGSKAGV